MAAQDFLAIIDDIAADNPAAATAFKQDVEARVATLTRHPDLGRPGRVASTQELVVRQTISLSTPNRPVRSSSCACSMAPGNGPEPARHPHQKARPCRCRSLPPSSPSMPMTRSGTTRASSS
nr:type II toxin-antitoxin system RelE/ParE family toxin [Pannonibacter sp. XCT-34]